MQQLQLILTFEALDNLAPPYLSSFLHTYSICFSLASILPIPSASWTTMGLRSFSCSAPSFWNAPDLFQFLDHISKPTCSEMHTLHYNMVLVYCYLDQFYYFVGYFFLIFKVFPICANSFFIGKNDSPFLYQLWWT